MLLSIVIPAYDRPDTLAQAIESLVEQVAGKFDNDVEIIVADDASPNDSLGFVREMATKHSFLKYVRYPQNIGLERNLIESSKDAKGEFLWIFGDDDFLETDDALEDIIGRLRADKFDMLILNRTRRSKDLSKLLSDNWMRLDGNDETFSGLRAFCLKYGFISVIGFITVNIFRREAFQKVDVSKYFGTMYPQLGAMLSAFHDKKIQLVARPLVCHRTETAEEKRAKLGNKKSESDFMADAQARNALYFSHPYIAMLDDLLDQGAFKPEDIVEIPENTVINGLLIDFLIECAELSLAYPNRFSAQQWDRTRSFFERIPLSVDRRARTKAIASKLTMRSNEAQTGSAISSLAESGRPMTTISVVTTSYNQADYLDECLSSVRDQTFQPLEHLVFDPGSTDGSREIARKYDHITLFEEPDDGQSDALNKGFAKAKGEIIAWLNSDDVFAHPDVFQRVVDRFNQPDAPDIVYGKGVFIGEQGEKLRDVYINKDPASLPWRLQQEDGILQPALFMKRSVIEQMGDLNGNLHYCMDYEYWIRCMKAGIKFAYVDEDFALARYHDSNKTFGQRGNSYHEVCEMLMGHFGYVNHVWLKRYAEFICDGFDGVLAHGSNTNVSDKKRLEKVYDQLLRDYNTSHLIFSDLEANASQKGKGDTLRELRARKILPSTPCKEVPLYQETEPAHTMYTVGPKRWAFNSKWKKSQIDKSHAFLRETIKNRKSDVCVIVGNGPSLKKTDLDLLKGHDVIISNNAFLEPKLNEYATYYTVVNYLVAEQSSHNINRIEGMAKILPYWSSYCLNETDNTYFIDAVGHAEFSKDLFKNASWRHTVTFYNMHIAFGLGYKRAILIGFDHSYKQKAGVKEGEIIVSQDKDENHFDSRYFQGKKWQAADVDMMEAMYKLAKRAYEEEGRELVNATVGGHLELFPRMDLKDALDMKPLPASKASATTVSKAQDFPRKRHAQVDETAVVAHLLAHKRGPTCNMIDVGAHIGTSSQYFHDLDWSIFCFEPDVKNRSALQERFKQAENVVIDPRAVSNQPAKGVSFFTSPESTGISGLHAFRDTHQTAYEVDVTTVADIIKSRGLSTIDFLKIDVEGFDLSVLKGVPWDTLKPDVVECEFEDAKTKRLGHNWQTVVSYLEEQGYAVYVSEWHPIIRYGIPHDWKRVVPASSCQMSPDAWGNLLAFRNDPGLETVQAAFDQLVTFRTDNNTSKDTVTTAPPKPESKQESRVTLQQSSPAIALPQVEAQPLSRYVRYARKVHSVSPRLYDFLRFFKRSAQHVWVRRLWTLPFILAAISLGAVALPEFGLITNPYLYFISLAGGFLALALVYVAFRAHSHAETLHIQLAAQTDELTRTKAQWARERRATDSVISNEKNRLNAVDAKVVQVQAEHSTQIGQLKDFNGQLAELRRGNDEIGARVTELHQVSAPKTELSRQAQAIQEISRDLAIHKSKSVEAEVQIAEHAALMKQVSQTVATNESKQSEMLNQLRAKFSTQNTELTAAIERIEGLQTQQTATDRQLNELLSNLNDVVGQIEGLQTQQSNTDAQITELLSQLAETNQLQQSETDALRTEVDELKLSIRSESESLQAELLAQKQELTDDIGEKTASIEKWAQFSNSNWYQHFNRRLLNEHYAVLESDWRKKLSAPIARSTLGYMANRACHIEQQLDGRLATSIEDILLRTLVARSIKGKTASVLEIGTLFGTGAAIMYDAMIGHYDSIHFTLLDPLEGYYAAHQTDILTGQRVDEQTLRRNLERVGLTEDKLTLIKHLSTDQEAIEAAAQEKYDVLVIDGDHSYAGVKTDFENYARNVKLGGFIIFDDYDSADWPDVKEYVDAELADSDFISRVGASWRTCVYRVVKNPDQRRAKRTTRATSSRAEKAPKTTESE